MAGSSGNGKSKGNCCIRKNCGPPDYNRYRFSLREHLKLLGVYLLFDVVLAGLFYRSVWAGVVGLSGLPFFYCYQRRGYIRQRKQKLAEQFKDALVSVAGAMRAGYSMENAFAEAEKDMIRLHGKSCDIVLELKIIRRQLECNVPIEKLLADLADRCQIEDVETFSNIMGFAKRSGGDFIGIISNCIHQISDKMEIMNTIETSLAARRLEQRIMDIVPLFIMAFINVTSGEFMEALYHNGLGICIMTLCLGAYIAAFLWSERIVEIDI
ncbi:MAG: type II secretion system F family protein [Roseburia sp.]